MAIKARPPRRPSDKAKDDDSIEVSFTTNGQADGADQLAAIGPIIQATWTLPPAQLAMMPLVIQASPPKVDGWILLDTGATATCIAEDVARDLGLMACGTRPTFGSVGAHRLTLYQAQVSIRFNGHVPSAPQKMVYADFQAAGIPDLHHVVAGLSVNGAPLRLVGLLGRDFLRYVDFTYSGRDGKIVITAPKSMFKPES